MTTTAQRASAPATHRPNSVPVHAKLIPAIICISHFMVVLDNSIVFAGLPQIRSTMGFSETSLSWITNTHVLVFGGLAADLISWRAPATLVPLVAGAAMLALSVRVEQRAAQPIVPLRLFASRERTGAYITRMLYMGAVIGFFFTAQVVQSVYHWTLLQAGLSFNTAHQIGTALSLSILTASAAAVSTGHAAADIVARSGTALTGSAALLALALVAVRTLVVPSQATHNERTV